MTWCSDISAMYQSCHITNTASITVKANNTPSMSNINDDEEIVDNYFITTLVTTHKDSTQGKRWEWRKEDCLVGQGGGEGDE